MCKNMVAKGVVKKRVKRGIIPSKDPTNDRAHTVFRLFELYSDSLPKKEKPLMINFTTHMLKEGYEKNFFSGKDPTISGIIVFLIAIERFNPYGWQLVTRNDIRRDFIKFGGGESFVDFKKSLEHSFESYKIK